MKNTIIGVIVALVIGLGVGYLIQSRTPQVKVGAISTATTNADVVSARAVVLGENCNTEYGTCTTGTVIDSSGNTDTGLSINGVGLSFLRQTVAESLTQATTTPCALLSPAATTTLMGVSILSTVGSTTATLTIATSTTAFATSSLIISSTLSGMTPVTWEGGANNTVVAPSTYVVFGLSNYGYASKGYQFTGVCTASFQTII